MASADRPAGVADEALYRAVLAGDEQALEELVRRYHGPLLGYIYHQTADRHLAEDLVQETFTRLVTYQGAPPRQFRPWALAIAGNLVRDYFRSGYYRREQTTPPDMSATPAEAVDPAASPASDWSAPTGAGRWFRRCSGSIPISARCLCCAFTTTSSSKISPRRRTRRSARSKAACFMP